MLFVPGDQPARMEKAVGLDADAVILDLEDAVSEAAKPAARAAVAEFLAKPRRRPVFVRINPAASRHCLADLEAVVPGSPDGIMLPKTNSPADVVAVDWYLSQAASGGRAGTVPMLMPSLESAAALHDVRAILAASARVGLAGIGVGDLASDLGVSLSGDERELAFARNAFVLGCRAAGVQAPIDGVYGHLADEEGLRRSAEAARRHGFVGKRCIHPRQIAIINAAFRPTEQELDFAAKVVEAADAAGGDPGAIAVDGHLVDAPVIARARQVLDMRAAHDRLAGAAR
jgi:citrate lyase subunit beta/citryl-CoA lyase